MPHWLEAHRDLFTVLAVASFALFVLTIALVPVVLVRLPPDYFVRPPPRRPVVVALARNVLGGVLVALGLAMLVLPGQGMLTILLGLCFLELPIKKKLLRRVLGQSKVRAAVQGLRARANRPPLFVPDVA